MTMSGLYGAWVVPARGCKHVPDVMFVAVAVIGADAGGLRLHVVEAIGAVHDGKWISIAFVVCA